MNSKPIELLKLALEKDELARFIKGDGIYNFTNKWIEAPTDLNTVFLNAFNEYLTTNSDEINHLNRKINEAILELLNDPIGCWWSISILHSYYCGYLPNVLLFKINVEQIVPRVNSCLTKYKCDLFQNKEYSGWRFENGLWEDILNIIPIINDKLKQNKIEILITF